MSPQWGTPHDSTVVPLGRAFILWSIVLVWGLVAMFVLGNAQSNGAAPEYTCAPGEVYTTKECQ